MCWSWSLKLIGMFGASFRVRNRDQLKIVAGPIELMKLIDTGKTRNEIAIRSAHLSIVSVVVTIKFLKDLKWQEGTMS